ncbi:glycosyltransferase family protein [Faecalibacter macacae]|uniref:Glycosyltransferase subfamily 4-like N-terminal domain-containing protein n=1 Tax=Faecalibacter macacae TaxID=1859289 RepID=A0A3L9MIT1_9FLAO|nr:hypothetical protein [Faecalibacter macacae]RLZ10549.1 hypothetical protein EAH69_07095 [Faecalibacter macacae]
MKILLISSHFFPLINPRSFRATELAKELVRQGNEVTVVTLHNSKHAEFSKEFNVEFKYLPDLKWKEISIQGGGISSKIKRGLRRTMQLVAEYPAVELTGLVKDYINKENKQYDALISIAVPYPIHWGVAASDWKKIAKTWIADCGDPYYGDTSDSFKKLLHFKYVEKWAFSKMDKIAIPIEGGKKGYFKEFHDKISIIPQGFDFNIEKSVYKKNPIPTFIYAGGFIPGYRDPQPFLEYLTKIDKEFKFIIYTKGTVLIKPFLQKLGDKIEIREYIPREELMLELSKADFLINIDNAESVQSPSKLIDYKIADRPILNIKKGKINEKLVNEFIDYNFENQLNINDLNRFDIKNVAKQFINLIKK